MKIQGRLELVKRLNNSVNGNPRYELCINDTKFVTAPDSMLAYEIPNYFDKLVNVELKQHYNRLTVFGVGKI